jgi:HAD superfamily hydrolase (TIGR01509 family)
LVATLFDFNGVLVDDEAVHLSAFRAVLAPLGVTISDEDYAEKYLGFDDVGAFRAMLTDAGRPPSDEDVARLVQAKVPEYMARIGEALVIFEGAAEIVRRRARLGPVGIVSGALRHEIAHALEVLGVSGEVAFIVSAEDTRECKPDPEGYELGKRALASRGHDPLRGVVVIEDSLAGVQAAKAAGLRCVAVEHSYPAVRLALGGADAVMPRLALLTDAILDGA